MGTISWKILGSGGAILAGIVAKKVVDAAWAKAGQDTVNPKSPDAPIGKAVAYAALLGLAVGAARTLTERKAAQYYRSSAGHLPKDIAGEPV
ncbi:DUF4235 domain-containing protein [Phycicoccus sp. CSK15P-2]|uniref:DUF4235 domain-containing protein n=1 Tax=Phycicoccus sp. CSK15P-2 TaxID=2807627 RepID=UPI0019513895|nr:DUF4235 domain-containing protein [Phycicoccus sp. CSK15P-2]MBM6404407.1 DUF4235 domain-containing protein [Phycicoccus sp. CSK15P-2]